jgi:hypothetical protein
MSKYPVLTSGRNPTEFVLTEANGQRSRDNAYLAHPVTITVGQPLQKTAEATTDKFATYVPATAGANCHAVALYGGTSTDAVEGLRISIISRDAELNYKLINFGSHRTLERTNRHA